MSYPSWQPGEGPKDPQARQGPGGVPSWRGQGAQPPVWYGQGGPPQPGYADGSHSMLASHADRERAVDVLRAGFGEGRMEQTEFEKRVARAYAARTVGELALLVADLPQGPVPLPAAVGAVPRTFLPLPVPKTNEKAIGSAICGGLCLVTFGLTGLPAVILGHSARAEIRRRGEGGDGLALTGLVIGWLATASWTLVVTLLLIAALTTG
ncbi:hypothetical protein FHS35_007119 [Streptomyces umbrinus]|uniref:DUF1707 and DUF4190 domain-containing protein n=1 Tax=Streptomyces umbrinus TaxID=67370 RepID=UPI0019AB277C|nr:hypothetical protein [Streptomyces umbrinus]GHH58614.1 hypothetical protein GCM10018775_68800 [Streptomyces umbrinus]